MRIRGGFEVDIRFAALVKAVRVLAADGIPTGQEVVDGKSVKAGHRNLQVGRLRVPLVNQLMSTAINVAAGDQDVVTSQNM